MTTPAQPKNRQGFKPPSSAKKGPAPKISADGNSGRGFTIAVVALVVLGMAAVAVLASQRDSDLPNGPQVSDVTIEGSPLPEFPRETQLAITDATNDAAVGQVAPTITGTTFDDQAVTIGPDGIPKALYFLAHHCQFCQAEVPVVQGLIDSGQKPDGMEIYAVSTSVLDRPNANYPPELWLNRENFTPSTIRDSENSQAFNAMGGVSFPYVVYVDGDNRVLSRSAGQLNESVTLALWNNLATGTSIGSVEGAADNSTSAEDAESGTGEDSPVEE